MYASLYRLAFMMMMMMISVLIIATASSLRIYNFLNKVFVHYTKVNLLLSYIRGKKKLHFEYFLIFE